MCRSLWCKHGWRKEPYYLSTIPDTKGYIYWCIPVDGTRVTHQAARWIAMTYPELVQNEYFEGAEIDHIDTNTVNNHPSNLRWVDRSGQMSNPLTRIHNRDARAGKHPTEETRMRMSEARKGKTIPHDVREKISRSHKGMSPSQETRDKISKSLTGRPGHPASNRQKQVILEVNKKKTKAILQIDKDTGEVIREHNSLADAALYMGEVIGKKVFDSNISKAALTGKTACGYRWRYK